MKLKRIFAVSVCVLALTLVGCKRVQTPAMQEASPANEAPAPAAQETPPTNVNQFITIGTGDLSMV